MKIYIFFLLLITNQLWAQNNPEALFNAGNYDACINLIKNNTDDKSLQLYINCLIRQNSFIEAELLLNKYQPNNQDNTYKKIYLNALISIQKGLIDDAILNLQKCELFFKNDEIMLSEIYNQLALCSWSEGNLEEASILMQKALRIRLQKLGNEHLNTNDLYNNFGLIELSKHNIENAKSNYQTYLSAYKSEFGTSHPSVAIAYNNISNIYKAENNLDSALYFINQSLEIREKLYGTKHSNYAFCLISKAEILKLKKDYLSATNLLLQSKDIYTTLHGKIHPEIASIWNILAEIDLQLNKYNDAIDKYHQAELANTESTNLNNSFEICTSNCKNSNLMLHSLFGKSVAYYKLYLDKTLNINHLKLSLKSLQKADTLVNSARQEKEEKKDKLELGKVASNIYEHAIKVCFTLSEVSLQKKKYQELAFYFSEKNKAATLMESIAESNARKFAGIPQEILFKEEYIKSNLNYYENQLNTQKINTLQDSVFKYKKLYNEFISSIEKSYPSYYQLKYAVNVVDIKSLQNKLNDKQLVVSYSVSDLHEEIYIFCIAKNYFKTYNCTANRQFYRYLAALKNGIAFDDLELFTKFNALVSEKLLSFKIPSQFNSLIIIPEGKISLLPFELLSKSRKNYKDFYEIPYLIKDYTIQNHLSATLFAQSVKMINNEKTILICAPVKFNDPKNEERTRLATLNGTKLESENIIKIADSNQVKTVSLLENKATEENLLNQTLKTFTYLHFATHGSVNEEFPEQSKIYLYTPQKNEKGDGALYTNEIFNLQLNAKLVTLSACETGKGQITKGEGVVGLSRSLIYAGAENLIVSHWKVSDKATALMMSELYRNLFKNNTISSSLREAKISMINTKTFAAPYYWAPFILIGD